MAWLKSFRELEVWKKAHGLALDVYRVTEHFPEREKYGIVAQLRRSAFSVPAKIAEGFGRRTTKEFLQSLGVASGSLEETRYFIILSADLGLLARREQERLELKCDSVAQLLGGLRRALNRKAHGTRGTGHGTQ